LKKIIKMKMDNTQGQPQNNNKIIKRKRHIAKFRK
jgi:hypothetical protein